MNIYVFFPSIILSIFFMSAFYFLKTENENLEDEFEILGKKFHKENLKLSMIFVLSIFSIILIYYPLIFDTPLSDIEILNTFLILIISFYYILEVGFERAKWVLSFFYGATVFLGYVSSLLTIEHIAKHSNVSPESLSTLIKYTIFLNIKPLLSLLLAALLLLVFFPLFHYSFFYVAKKIKLINGELKNLKNRKTGYFKHFIAVKLLPIVIFFSAAGSIFQNEHMVNYEKITNNNIYSIFTNNDNRCSNIPKDELIYIYADHRAIRIKENNYINYVGEKCEDTEKLETDEN